MGLAVTMSSFLLVHGIPGSGATWDGVRAKLEPEHRVLAPDLLGFGGQPRPPGPDALLAPGQARHLLELLDREGMKEVIVVAHDFGGPVAAHLLAMAPSRVYALALFATNAFPDTPVPFPLSLVRVPLLGPLAARMLFSRQSMAMMVRRGVGDTATRLDVDRYLGDKQQQAAIASIFEMGLRRLGELYAPVERALATAGVPALVGWGDRDPFFPVAIGRRTAALLPDARFRLYEGAGHFLPDERPEELAADVLALAALADIR
jgi:pimeloyl-ACP methyl ester carboxylesterase